MASSEHIASDYKNTQSLMADLTSRTGVFANSEALASENSVYDEAASKKNN